TRRIQRATYLLSIEDGVTKRNKNGKVLGCGTHPNMESFHHPSLALIGIRVNLWLTWLLATDQHGFSQIAVFMYIFHKDGSLVSSVTVNL
ncbi:MAG: hypothetical protein U9N46_12625, partial [Euryarchaeota archaeon]|nr:hypothetical protein [Euryarchaeota archaeon]